MKISFNIILNTFLFCLTSCSFSQTEKKDLDVITIPAGKGASSVEVADVNKDGKPDIVIANIDDSSISILLNAGNRQFKQANGSPLYAGHFPNDINIADFNKDGNLDLAI